jgi:DNA-binding NtrC family response regulator
MKPTILIIDDEVLVRENLKIVFDMEGYNVLLAGNGEEGVGKFADNEPDVVLLDVKLPDIEGKDVLERIRKIDNDAVVLIITGVPGFEDTVEFIKSGAYDYLPKPLDVEELKFHVDKAIESARLRKRVEYIEKEEIEKYGFDKIIGESKAINEVCSLASRVAVSSTTPVLITGESGTGKELLARAIHLSSPRRDKPFVIVNCTTLSEDLLESDLFGHEKGAFTGAIRKKIGKFEIAQTGTIFLDEIGDLYPKLQMKLLRVLQEHEIERVGGTFPIKVDVRVISATNKDLTTMVKDRGFREDLYYRLNVVNIKLPPLRERRDDILLLSRRFVDEFSREFKKEAKLSADAENFLMAYQWRGNIRELRNVIERTVLLSNKNIIEPGDLPEDILYGNSKPTADIIETAVKPLMEVNELVPLEKVEDMYIQKVLDKTGGNKSEAARILGITRQRLARKIDTPPE